MNEAPRPHPLDADDDDDQRVSARRYRPVAPALAHQPLLKPSLIVAGVATVTLFASSALSIITPLESPANNVSLLAFRLSGVVLMLALGGVLVAYRIGQFARKPAVARPPRLLRVKGYRGFLLANTCGLIGFWFVLLSLAWALGGSVSIILGPLMMILAGLLATMIVWHRGYLRAFAIGSIIALVPGMFPVLMWSTTMLFNGGFSNNRGMPGPMNVFVVSAGITLTIAQISGLVSAGYVVALESWQQRQPPALADVQTIDHHTTPL